MNLNVLLIIMAIAIIGFNIYMFGSRNSGSVIIRANYTYQTTTMSYRPTNIVKTCTTAADCQWLPTNCCSENSGAQWQCLNKQTYVDCLSTEVLCPQVISSQPVVSCGCVNGVCTG